MKRERTKGDPDQLCLFSVIYSNRVIRLWVQARTSYMEGANLFPIQRIKPLPPTIQAIHPVYFLSPMKETLPK